jgi:hypothetical protein
MKTKSISRFWLVSLAMASMFLVSSCSEESAEPDIPGADRDKYVGSWLCKEFENGSQVAAFTIEIEKVGNNDSLRVYNFSNIGSNFFGIWLISGNSITIPNQNVTSIEFDGFGFYDGGDLSLSYKSDDTQIDAICTRN